MALAFEHDGHHWAERWITPDDGTTWLYDVIDSDDSRKLVRPQFEEGPNGTLLMDRGVMPLAYCRGVDGAANGGYTAFTDGDWNLTTEGLFQPVPFELQPAPYVRTGGTTAAEIGLAVEHALRKPLTASQKTAVVAFLASGVGNGWWAHLHALYVSVNASADAFRVNWKTQLPSSIYRWIGSDLQGWNFSLANGAEMPGDTGFARTGIHPSALGRTAGLGAFVTQMPSTDAPAALMGCYGANGLRFGLYHRLSAGNFADRKFNSGVT